MLAQARFSDPALEAQYKQERADQLAQRDMQSAALFCLLWAWDCFRFLGLSWTAVLRATAWLAAVGLKPVYVCKLVGRPFYLQFRSWIVMFTKVVYVTAPPAEGLHLAALARASAPASLARALWVLGEGVRLPYLLVTGIGWVDVAYSIPVQLALVGRALRDNLAQCSTPYFQSMPAQALLRGVAVRLTRALRTLLFLGAPFAANSGASHLEEPAWPAALDPCVALGTWTLISAGFLLPALIVLTSERRARAKFAASNAARLSEDEREYWRESGVSCATWTVLLAVLGYACVLLWQVVISVLWLLA